MEQTFNDFSTLFLECYPERSCIVTYVREALGKQDIALSDLTRVNIKKINDTILSHVTHGSAKTYFAQLKHFINLYAEDIPGSDSTKLLHAKHMPSQNVYLTEDEISQLESYLDVMESRQYHRCKDKVAIDILHAFLAECYCGARGCDVQAFTDDNFHDGMLTYISKKTKVMSQLPVHKHLRRHLAHVPQKEYTDFTKNRSIKRICEELGFDEPKTLFYHGKLQTHPKFFYVGFHTARRSFATNLHLRNVPLAVIAQLMNHGSDLQMTQRYIVTDATSIGDNALAFFK